MGGAAGVRGEGGPSWGDPIPVSQSKSCVRVLGTKSILFRVGRWSPQELRFVTNLVCDIYGQDIEA